MLNLLLDLQEEFNLTYIFISHDLSVVKFFSDEVGVANGKLVEYSDFNEVYENPKEPYTKKLLNAIPKGIIVRNVTNKPPLIINTRRILVIGILEFKNCQNYFTFQIIQSFSKKLLF